MIASLFGTGSVPGWPRQTGQTFTFGCFSSGSFRESQNIFVRVLSSSWISKPIVGLYSAIGLIIRDLRRKVKTTYGKKHFDAEGYRGSALRNRGYPACLAYGGDGSVPGPGRQAAARDVLPYLPFRHAYAEGPFVGRLSRDA